MKKKINVASIVLALLFIISAAVFLLFYCSGYGVMETINGNTVTSPTYTGLVLVWMYTLVALCTLTVVVFGIINGIRSASVKTKGKYRTGFGGWVFLITLFVLAGTYFFLASDAPLRTGEGLVEDALTLKAVDVCLYTIYGLVGVTLLSALLSMTGVFKSRK